MRRLGFVALVVVLTAVATAFIVGCGGDEDGGAFEQAPGVTAPTSPAIESVPEYEADANAAEARLSVVDGLRQAYRAAGAVEHPAVASDDYLLLDQGGIACTLYEFTYDPAGQQIESMRVGFGGKQRVGIVTNAAGDLAALVSVDDPGDKPACLRAAGAVIDPLVVGQAGLQRDPNRPAG